MNNLGKLKEGIYDLCYVYRYDSPTVDVLENIAENVKEVLILPESFLDEDVLKLHKSNLLNIILIVDDENENDLDFEMMDNETGYVNNCIKKINKNLLKKELPLVLLVKDIDYEVFLSSYYDIYLSKFNSLFQDYLCNVEDYEMGLELDNLFLFLHEKNLENFNEYYINLLLDERRFDELKFFVNSNK